MKHEHLYTTTQIEKILNEEFKKFSKKHRAILNIGDFQTMAKYIEQVKEELNKPSVNLA